ncbi:EamA family transporter [Brevibacillus ginsengisoli]|uniref:EamA family transporter n=1 Tax=Brevibacillus ginsengisoli TaxID=363854 RepID=UPI003CEA5C05
MFRYIMYVFLGACSYGVLSTLVKLAYQAGFQPGDVVGAQNFFGMLMMLIPWIFMRKSTISMQQWMKLIGVGCTLGLTGILYYACLQFMDASIAIVLLFQFTWMGVLLEAGLQRRWPSKDKWIVLGLLLVGTFLAAGVIGKGMESLNPLGIVLGLLSALTYALFILFSGKVATSVDTWSRSAIMSIGSLLIVVVTYHPTFLWSGALTDGLWIWGILLAIFGVLISTLLLNLGVPHIGVGLATILGSAELPTAVLMSSVVLGESVNMMQWLGVILILFAISLPEWKRRRETQTQ